jgi:NTE family protein
MDFDMVFEGGGAKGMVFVGALQELESHGHKPARLMGSSAGAIMATFLAAGYDAKEMEDALKEERDGEPVFKGFLEIPPALNPDQINQSAFRKLLQNIDIPMIPDFIEGKLEDILIKKMSEKPPSNQLLFFFDYGGFYAGQYFLNWLQEKLNEGTYQLERGKWGKGNQRQFAGMNLKEYYTATGAELSLIASDTTEARMLILNHRTAPECPLIWAVRMSMSFPLLWQEVVWDKSWGTYRGRDLAGHTIVDGGMLSNFPIELFLSDQPHVTHIMGEKASNARLLGFLIDDALEVPDAPKLEGKIGIIDQFLGGEIELQTTQRIGKLINTLTQAHDKMIIDEYNQFVVHLPAKGYHTTEFDMTKARRDALINAGRQATIEYLQTHGLRRERSLEPKTEPKPEYSPDFYKQADRISSKLLDL